MLTYPQIDPVAISLVPISVHCYGIMNISAFGGAWVLATYRAARVADPWTAEQISDLIFYGALGAVIGGRMGSVLFYNFVRFVEDPLWLFRVWEGGMSFHGGFRVCCSHFFSTPATSKKITGAPSISLHRWCLLDSEPGG